MSATRVLVTGARGQVGVDLVDILSGLTPPGADRHFQPDLVSVRDGEFDVTACGHRDLDVTRPESVHAALEKYEPHVVVNLAAYTRVDQAESDESACDAANHLGPALLTIACERAGSHLITVSTDYVFDGEKGSAYVEGDPPDPLNVYGATKLAGERACTAQDTVVRTSWVMGVRGQSVAHVVAERVRRGDAVQFVTDQVGTVTVAADLARVLVTFVRERPGGTWHIANSGAVSWFDVAREIARAAVGSDALVAATTTAERVPAPAARRPARSDLDTTKWCGSGFAPLPAWREAVGRLVGAN